MRLLQNILNNIHQLWGGVGNMFSPIEPEINFARKRISVYFSSNFTKISCWKAVRLLFFILLYLRSRHILYKKKKTKKQVKCVFSRILTRNIFRFKLNKWHISQTKQTTKYFFNSTYFVDNLPVNQSILVWNLQKRKFN